MRTEELERLQPLEIPGLVVFDSGRGGLPRATITTPWSTAELYLHGAQVTGFQNHGEPPLLFLSEHSRFEAGKAVRGGVPICFPWFGPREGSPAHGFARITDWELLETTAMASGGAGLRLRLPQPTSGGEWPTLTAEIVVTVTESLSLELIVTNQGQDQDMRFEECLHTYFEVGNAGEISITGLEQADYVDHLDHGTRHVQNEPVRIVTQTDRTYLDHEGAVEIRDPVLRRTVRIVKRGSSSSVVWNPWTTQILSDLGPEEYRRMVCVESGNVGRNQIVLPPGKTATLNVELSSRSESDR